MDIIEVSSSDEEDNPKHMKTINSSNMKVLKQSSNPRILKKVKNSMTITPIYNNSNNSIIKNPSTNNVIQLDKNRIAINSINVESRNSPVNIVSQKINYLNNNNRLSTTHKCNENSAIKLNNYKKRSNNNSPANTPSISATNQSTTLKTINNNSIAISLVNSNTKSNPLPAMKLNTIDILPIPVTNSSKTITTTQLPKITQVISTKVLGNCQQKIPDVKKIIDISVDTKNKSNPIKKPAIKRKLEPELIIPTKFVENIKRTNVNSEKPLSPIVAASKNTDTPSPPIKRITPITLTNKVTECIWHKPKKHSCITINVDDDEEISSPKSNKQLASPKLLPNLTPSIPNQLKMSKTITSNSVIEPNKLEKINEQSTLTEKIVENSSDMDTNSAPTITSPATPNGKIDSCDVNDDSRTNPLTPAYTALLAECRKADPSVDMEQLIEKKLLKYYHSVHPDFVSSRGFRKAIESTIDGIKNSPQLVYIKLKTIVEELKTRRNSREIIISNEDHKTTGNAKKDAQVRRLSFALYKLQRRIKRLEETDVDWDQNSDSTYLKESRYKRRAYKIYEKICDLTGESKHAHRLVSKPISFHGTTYPIFNKTIQSFVNRTKMFPDYLDILQLLEFSNKQNSLGISKNEIQIVARDAFVKVGELLQKRRQNDLYETATYIAGDATDPAEQDTELNLKLTQNLKLRNKPNTVIEMFAKRQENKIDEKHKTNDDSSPSTSFNGDETKTSDVGASDNQLKSNNQPTETDESKSLTENSNNILINNQPSTSSSELKIVSVQSLQEKIVCEIVVSDDDET